LILTAVLIAAVVYLQSIPEEPLPIHEMGDPPMSVMSETPELPTIDSEEILGENRDALFDTGVELLDLWHLPEAAGLFEKVVESDSTHVGAYLRLVECYSHPVMGLETKAKHCLDSAFRAARDAGADTLWALALHNLYIAGEPEGAVTAFEKLERENKNNDDVLLFLAAAHIENGEPAKAERYLGDLLDRDPSMGRAKELYIRCKVAAGEYGDAESAARDLAALYPEEPYPYVLLSQVLLLRGKTEKAVEFANNALRLDPRFIPAIAARARLHVAEGELEAARVNLEKLLLFDKPMLSAFGKAGIANIEFLSGDFDRAARDMDEAIRLAMRAGSTQRGLVFAFRHIGYLCELGRTDMATDVLDRWVTRFGDIPTRLGQMRVLIAQGDMAPVRHGLERIKDARAWRHWMHVLGIDLTNVEAMALIREQDFAGALDVMGAAEATYDDAGRRAYLQGYASFESGAAEQAAAYFETARTRMHDLTFPYFGDSVLFVQSVFFQAEVAFARGEALEASEYYREFLGFWEDAVWELQAVERARQNLETLSGIPTDG
jgi:tetratricopeptide (TPR) repeat protein